MSVGGFGSVAHRLRAAAHRNKVLDSSAWKVVSGRGRMAPDFSPSRNRTALICLVHEQSYTVYLHPVLEAKLVDTRGLALSLCSEFIENRSQEGQIADHSTLTSMKPSSRIANSKPLPAARNLKPSSPNPLLLGGDSLYACGPVFTICASYQCPLS